MRFGWELHANAVARSYLSSDADLRHHASFANQLAALVMPERGGHQAGLDAVQLRTRISKTRDLDDRVGAEMEPRARRQREQIDAARGDVLAHLPRRELEAGAS